MYSSQIDTNAIRDLARWTAVDGADSVKRSTVTQDLRTSYAALSTAQHELDSLSCALNDARYSASLYAACIPAQTTAPTLTADVTDAVGSVRAVGT